MTDPLDAIPTDDDQPLEDEQAHRDRWRELNDADVPELDQRRLP